MSVIAFFSSKGAPGTTTAAMLAASLWPRPALLADCDPAGGDLSGEGYRPTKSPDFVWSHASQAGNVTLCN